jgi:hypothetical protein
MKIAIDFSIFESPVRAYGNVTGTMEVAAIPEVGTFVPFIGKHGLIVDSGFPGISRVISVTPVLGAHTVFGLDDVVVSTHAIAVALAKRLAREMNLFVVEYERDLGGE